MLGWELPPHNSGGLGVACYQLCKALAKNGCDIEFVLPFAYEHDVDFMTVSAATPQDVSQVEVSGTAYQSHKYTFHDGHEEWLDMYDQQSLFEHAVASMAKGRQFDVIHAHDWLTVRAALRAKAVRDVPLIVHMHSVEADRAGAVGGGNPLVREIEALGVMMADRVIAVSQLTKDAIIREYDIPADKISVVHTSIDIEDLLPLDTHNAYSYLERLKEDGWRIVTNVGRLTVQKGLPNFLEAAKLVVDKAPKTLFLIVGNGEQYHELIEQAARLGISKNVLFVGFQRGKQWRDAFAIADLFVMPSLSEPFGLTPLEALYYGAPSLISRQSGVAEILRNCLKVDYWDIEEMANKIIAVVKHDALRDELSRSGTIELSRLSWDTSAQKLTSMYRSHAGAVV